MEKVRDKGGVLYDVVSSDEKQPDKSVSNKWKWEWLEEKDHGTENHQLKDYLLKVNVEGVAFCRWCKLTIKYGSTGKKACLKHAKTSHEHQSYIKSMKGQCQLPSTHQVPSTSKSTAITTTTEATGEKIVHILDRKSHLEAYILQFICDNNLPLSMAPRLLEFGTVILDDVRAFKSLAKEEADDKEKFSRPTATYKITHGLSVTFQSRIVAALRTTPFSINIDECTSETGIKVFSIIVMYFDRCIGKSVIQNYKSVSILKGDAESLASIIVDQLKEDEIPMQNLVADLSDSASAMRGKKSGVEKRLRDVAPHMLSIGGDTCHDMHRCCKTFAVKFEKHVEKFIGDVHNDVKYSVDIKQFLSDLCLITGESFHKPPERTDHRWLSTYDCIVKIMPMISSLQILYFSFLPGKAVGENIGKDMYDEDFKKLLDEKAVTEKGRTEISKISKTLGRKKMTKDGISRKERINEKLWEKFDKTMLIMHQYDVIYPMFKSFVLVFEQKTPQIHKLYSKLVEVLRQFLSAFMKFELIKNASGSALKAIEISEKTVRDKNDLFYGAKNERLMKKMKNLNRGDIVSHFQTTVKESYMECGKYLRDHVPLDEPVLKCLASLNPMSIGDSTNHKYLKKLGDFFPQLLDDDEKLEGFLKDVGSIQLDNCLPPALQNEKEVDLDAWWHQVMLTKKYPFLTMVVEACLSIFSGPIVEGTFSTLNITMDKVRNRLNCETYDAILKCKMFQKSKGKSSFDTYHRKDPLRSPVDLTVCKSMRLAKSRYEKSKNRKKASFKKKLIDIGGKPTKPRAKKGEKMLKSVHELNEGLKDVMASSAVGKKVKDVSREVLPAKQKPLKDIRRSRDCDADSDKQNLDNECAPPKKKKKQSDMFSFLSKNKNEGKRKATAVEVVEKDNVNSGKDVVKSNNEKCNEKGGNDDEIEVVDLDENEESAKEKVPQVIQSTNQSEKCERRENKNDKTRKKEFIKGKKKVGKKKNKIEKKKSLSKKFRKTHVDLQGSSNDGELLSFDASRYRFSSDDESESNDDLS